MKTEPLKTKWPAGSLWVAITLFVAVVFSAWRPILGYDDLWFHAAVGRWIVEHARVPHRTLFLWSANYPFIAHSWLSEVLLYKTLALLGTYRAGFALTAAICLFAFAGYLFCVLPALRAPRINPLVLPAGVLAVWCAATRFQPRPEMFDELFIGLTLLFIDTERANPTPKRIWTKGLCVAALFVLWTNMHGSVALGLAFLTIALVIGFAQDRDIGRAKRMAALLAAALIGTLANPYGIGYYRIYSRVHSVVFSLITEWHSPFSDPSQEVATSVYCGLLVLAVASWLLSARRNNIPIALLALGTALFAAAERNALVASLIGLYAVASYSSDAAPTTTPRGQWLERLYSKGWMAYAGAFVALAAAAYTGPLTDSPHTYPYANLLFNRNQIDLIRRSGYRGRVLNDYELASYEEYALYGTCTFFIDTQDAYPDSLVLTMGEVLEATPDGLRYLDNHDVGCVIGRFKGPGDAGYPPLYQYLTNSPSWRLTVIKDEGPVWFRRTPTAP